MYERRRLTPLGTLLLSFFISLFAIADAMAFFNKANPEDQIGGSIRTIMGERAFYFPTLKKLSIREGFFFCSFFLTVLAFISKILGISKAI